MGGVRVVRFHGGSMVEESRRDALDGGNSLRHGCLIFLLTRSSCVILLTIRTSGASLREEVRACLPES